MDLPIQSYLQEIIDYLDTEEPQKNEQVLIVEADTGAGKSTLVPYTLADVGFNVICTQPRRIAARSLYYYISRNGTDIMIGYKTGEINDERRHPDNKLLLCTDGIALNMFNSTGDIVLIIDEIHEMNIRQEGLLYLAKKRIEEGDTKFRLVLMSATIGTIINKLREYFWNCKVISVPGRTFPIETRLKYTPKGYEKQYDTMARQAIDLAEESKNVMIFLPGKGEIETFQNILKYKDHNKVYQLHAEMERDAQNETLSASIEDKGIIVLATNVAETSITPDGIDVVIDSGQERIKISNNGIPKISLIDISYHKAKQRKGRVGRTKPGIYIDYGTSYKPEEDTPEILREDLSSLYLSMLNNDIKMEEAIFFNNPGITEVRQAKELVEILRFVKGGELTEEGMIAIQLGTTCRASKIIIEANKRNITNDGILMALLMEISLLKHDCKIDRIKELLNYKKYNSDILVYMDIFRKIQKAINEDNQVVINNLRNIGIKLKAYFEIIKMGQKLEEKIEQLFEDDDDVETTENTLLECILASFPDRVYNRYRYKYTSNDGKLYILDNNSFVSTFDKIVGVPVQRGGYLIITNATNAGRNT